MEGLQIERFNAGRDWRLKPSDKGEYCLFSDAEKFHNQAQEAIDKNMKLMAGRSRLVKALKGIRNRIRGGWICPDVYQDDEAISAWEEATKAFQESQAFQEIEAALKAAGEEV